MRRVYRPTEPEDSSEEVRAENHHQLRRLRRCGDAAMRRCGDAAMRRCGDAAMRRCGDAAIIPQTPNEPVKQILTTTTNRAHQRPHPAVLSHHPSHRACSPEHDAYCISGRLFLSTGGDACRLNIGAAYLHGHHCSAVGVAAEIDDIDRQRGLPYSVGSGTGTRSGGGNSRLWRNAQPPASLPVSPLRRTPTAATRRFNDEDIADIHLGAVSAV